MTSSSHTSWRTILGRVGVEGTVDFTVTQLIETKAGNTEETQWAWEELFVNIFDFFLTCTEFYLV